MKTPNAAIQRKISEFGETKTKRGSGEETSAKFWRSGGEGPGDGGLEDRGPGRGGGFLAGSGAEGSRGVQGRWGPRQGVLGREVLGRGPGFGVLGVFLGVLGFVARSGVNLAKVGLAKVGHEGLAKVGLAKVGHDH